MDTLDDADDATAIKAAAGCLARTEIKNQHGEDCGGMLVCVLDTDHAGPHYDATDEIWWQGADDDHPAPDSCWLALEVE